MSKQGRKSNNSLLNDSKTTNFSPTYKSTPKSEKMNKSKNSKLNNSYDVLFERSETFTKEIIQELQRLKNVINQNKNTWKEITELKLIISTIPEHGIFTTFSEFYDLFDSYINNFENVKLIITEKVEAMSKMKELIIFNDSLIDDQSRDRFDNIFTNLKFLLNDFQLYIENIKDVLPKEFYEMDDSIQLSRNWFCIFWIDSYITALSE